MHDIPTPQALADTIFVKAITMEKEAETKAAHELMQEFKRARGQEMKRLADDVIKPHIRHWSRQWFEAHGLDTSVLPEVDEPEPAALVS